MTTKAYQTSTLVDQLSSLLAEMQATRTVQTIAATSAGQTTFTTAGYTQGLLNVYLMGVRLNNGTDYTATDGSTIILSTDNASLVTVGSSLTVEALTAYAVADAVQASQLASSTGATLVGYGSSTVSSALNNLTSTRTVQSITASSNAQTTFVTSGYTPGLINVYVAGIRLSPADFTATDGTNIILGASTAAYITNGTVIIVESLMSYAVANAVTISGFSAQMQTWFNSLPTSFPSSAGVLWNNGGTLSLS